MINGLIIGLLVGVLITWDVFRRQGKHEQQAIARSAAVLEAAACDFDRLFVLSRAHKHADRGVEEALATARSNLHDTALSYAATRGYRLPDDV